MNEATEDINELYKFVSENIPNITIDMIDTYQYHKELKDSISKLQTKNPTLQETIKIAINDL
jgi:hypothetical protein